MKTIMVVCTVCNVAIIALWAVMNMGIVPSQIIGSGSVMAHRNIFIDSNGLTQNVQASHTHCMKFYTEAKASNVPADLPNKIYMACMTANGAVI